MTARRLATSTLWLAVLVLCWSTLKAAVSLGLKDDRYLQIVTAPFLAAFLIFWERNRIFPNAAGSVPAGVPLLAAAASIYLFIQHQSSPDTGVHLALATAAVILLAIAAFVVCYGLRSLRAACFPLACLLLMIPIPVSAMDQITAGLQHGSAAVSLGMLRLSGIPVFAEGMRMSLKGVEIEVAPECSGIRSCIALAMFGLLLGRVRLQYSWTVLALGIATIPIAILKNALRISVLASLSAYVDPAFLQGRLHHQLGGLVFTPLGVVLVLAALAGLRRCESRNRPALAKP